MHSLSLFAVFLTMFSWLAPASPAQQATFEPTILEGRGGVEIEAKLGYLEVPENRSKKQSGKIRLAFLRVRALTESDALPVFVLAGGPGGSSIAMLKSTLRRAGNDYRELVRGDIVAIDQRGVGLSRPNLQSSVRFGFPTEEPGDPERMLEIVRKKCREVARKFTEQGVDLSGYTTVESADDIDAVRRALGYDKIVLWGGSYGSHLALATLRSHGAHVARVIASGPEGPDHTIKLPSYAEEGLGRIAKLVAEHPRLGDKIPDLEKLLKKVLDRLAEKPVYVDFGRRRVGISKFDVQMVIAGAIGRTRNLRPVPAAIYKMANGDFTWVANRIGAFRNGWGVRSAMSMMMDCASGLSRARAALIEKEAKQCLLGDSVNFPFPDIADAWGNPDLGPEFRGPLRSDVPVLFVAGDLDSRTPIRNAKELMEHLPNSHLVIVENAGHDLPSNHPELLQAIRQFLRGQPVTVTRVKTPPPKLDSVRE